MVSFRSGQAILVLTIALLVSHHARSESRYGAGPVKIVVPFAPGGTTDVIARILAQGLSAESGSTILYRESWRSRRHIGSRSGGEGSPDGQTMLVYHIGLVYGPGLYKQLPYDVEKDFTPVTLVGLAPEYSRRQPRPARAYGQRTHRARQGEAGRAQLRLRRNRKLRPSRGRASK